MANSIFEEVWKQFLFPIALKVHQQMEIYCQRLTTEDQQILRKYWVPVSNIYKRRKQTLEGYSVSEEELVERSVRESCIGMTEEFIMKIVLILDKAHKFIEPQVFEMSRGYEPYSSRSDILIQGSNCHYTRDFLLKRISQRPNCTPNRDDREFQSLIMTTEFDLLSSSRVLSAVSLESLEEMKIIDLVPCKIHKNKVIYATIIDNGFMINAYHTVIEDSYAQCAKLCIYNINTILHNALKTGVKIAVVNPYYKLGDEGCYFIRQESPEEVIIVSDSIRANNSKSSDEHKREGNKFFNRKDYETAIRCYTRAIKIDRSDPIYWNNRAQSYIKLAYYEEALADAETASRLNTNCTKSKFRMAMAWSGLGDHEKSCKILQSIRGLDSTPALEKELTLLGNVKGEFDFDELGNKAKRDEELEIGEYIGPISIKISHSHGHGIFATRNIKRGELISVSKAACFINQSNEEDLKNPLFFEHEPIGKYADSRTLFLIKKLTEKVIKSKLYAFRILPLYNKRHPDTDINIELYTAKGYSCVRNKDSPAYNIQQIRDIVSQYVFSYTPNFSTNYVRPSGVWPILAFCNHSCTGNIWQKCYKDVLIIRACTDISEGSELTTSFFDTYAFLTVEDRREKLFLGWKWDCNCEMCEFESNPRNKVALQRAVHLCTRVNNTDQIISSKKQLKLLNRAFELADLLKLGPNRFNSAVWQSIIALTRLMILNEDFSSCLNVLYQARKYLCKRDLKHQWYYWMNCLLLANSYELPDNEFMLEAKKKFDEVESYIMDIA